MRKLACVIALLIAFPSVARANVAEENFVLDTTADLIALCGVDAADPNAMAAIHMCHGYFVGLVHFSHYCHGYRGAMRVLSHITACHSTGLPE